MDNTATDIPQKDGFSLFLPFNVGLLWKMDDGLQIPLVACILSSTRASMTSFMSKWTSVNGP